MGLQGNGLAVQLCSRVASGEGTYPIEGTRFSCKKGRYGTERRYKGWTGSRRPSSGRAPGTPGRSWRDGYGLHRRFPSQGARLILRRGRYRQLRIGSGKQGSKKGWGVTRGPEPRGRGLGCSSRRFEINLLFLAKRSKHRPTGDAAGILTGANMLSEVGDAIEVFAGSLVRCQRVWTLVPGEVLERSLIGFGDADHDSGVVMRGVN